MRLNSALANARKYFLVANLPELMFRPLFLLAFIFAAVALSLKLSSTLLMAFNLVVIIVSTAWIGFILHIRADKQQMPGDSSYIVDAGSSSRWRKLAFPMIFATLFVNLFADLDILIVGSILPAAQIGVFGVCIKITFIMAYAIQIAHQILLRDASDAFADDKQRELRAVIINTNRFTVAVTLAGLIMTVVFGSRILAVFGEEFPAGYGCLIALMSAQLIRAMAGPAIQMLMISGNQRDSLFVYFICIILLLVLNAVLVPSYGYMGAAVAVICTTIYLVVALDRIVRQKLGYSVSIISCGK
jgi:O-antigen/teichoic acid export membrane protein